MDGPVGTLDLAINLLDNVTRKLLDLVTMKGRKSV